MTEKHQLRARQLLRFCHYSKSDHVAKVTRDDLDLARELAGPGFPWGYKRQPMGIHANSITEDESWPQLWDGTSAKSIAQCLRYWRALKVRRDAEAAMVIRDGPMNDKGDVRPFADGRSRAGVMRLGINNDPLDSRVGVDMPQVHHAGLKHLGNRQRQRSDAAQVVRIDDSVAVILMAASITTMLLISWWLF